jgi:DNA-directed RNA polymerase subunit N (RpoN/RPB10)
MIIPVRCITCGKEVGSLWKKYNEEVTKGRHPKEVLDELGLTRYCCRALFLTHRDVLKKTARFKV